MCELISFKTYKMQSEILQCGLLSCLHFTRLPANAKYTSLYFRINIEGNNVTSPYSRGLSLRMDEMPRQWIDGLRYRRYFHR